MNWITFPTDIYEDRELTASADLYVEGVSVLRLYVFKQKAAYSVTVTANAQEIGTVPGIATAEDAMQRAETEAARILNEALLKLKEKSL
jgi:hypothetical protein